MTSKQHPEIAIIGCGLSGLALGLHLSAQGIKAKIYEFRPASYSQGGAIALSPNAMRVLDHLGIYPALAKRGYNSDGTVLQNRSGKVLGELKQGSIFGYQALRLNRHCVREELLAECKRKGVEIVYEKKFAKLEEGGEKIKVFFEDGDVLSVDFVVGADGLRSGVRRFVDNTAEATYNGSMLIYGSIPESILHSKMGDKKERLQMPSLSMGKEGGFLIWPTDYDGQDIGFFASFSMPDRSREEWEKLGNDAEALRGILVNAFCQGPWSEQIEIMCREASAESFSIWPINMVPWLSSWRSRSGKIILIGDAAHAIAPAGAQGGAMAFEDAETLAHAMTKFEEDPSSLQKWEAHRRARVQQIIDFNNMTAKVREATKYDLVQWAREWFIWALLKVKGPEGYRWMYGYDGAAEMSKL